MHSAGPSSAGTSSNPNPAKVPGGLKIPGRINILGRLKKRAEFLRVAKGRRFFTPAFALQATVRGPDAVIQSPRFGFTVTKKTGNSVERNRIRRRLREVVRQAQAMDASPGYDYVIVAQRMALARPFADLVTDVERAVAEINAKLGRKASQTRT